MLFNWTKQDKTCQFSRKSSFSKATYSIKTEKQTISSLSLCQFDVGRLAEGRGHETNIKQSLVQLKSVLFNLLCVLDHESEQLVTWSSNTEEEKMEKLKPHGP